MLLRSFLPLVIATTFLASCGGSMQMKTGKLLHQAELSTHNIGTSDHTWVLSLSDGSVATVALGVDDLIHVAKLNNNLQELWRLTIPAEDHELDVLNIHELKGSLVIPVSIKKTDAKTDVNVTAYGYHAVNLSNKSIAYTELDVRTEGEICMGLPGETSPKSIGFRHEGFEAELGDQKLVFSPSRNYSMTYRFDGLIDGPFDSMFSIHVSVFDRELKSIRREKIDLQVDENEQLTGVRIDDKGAIIVLLQDTRFGNWLRKLERATQPKGQASTPMTKSGSLRAVRCQSGERQVSVSLSLGLDEVYSLAMEVGSNGRLYVAGLAFDDSKFDKPLFSAHDFDKIEAITLKAVSISVIDFANAKATNTLQRIHEDTLKRYFDKKEFLNGAIDRLMVDQANNRVLLLIEETGKVYTKWGNPSIPKANETSTQRREREFLERGRKTRDLVCGNVYALAFDLDGKQIWKQGIKKDQRQRPALGYYTMGYFNTITPEKTLAVLYLQDGLQFHEYNLATGEKVNAKTVAEFSGMHSFIPSLTSLVSRKEMLAVVYLGAFSSGSLCRISLE